jgi:hypothetical protein
MSEPRIEPHKQPPHERRVLNVVELYTHTCPQCGKEALTLIHEYRAGKLVKTFCHKCPEPEQAAAT